MTAQDLKNSILQLAVQGKLVPQDPKDEPASELLKRINAAKLRLIKEGKIKKKEQLPPIPDDEIPFDIPESWVWVHVGDLGETQTGSTPSKKVKEFWGGRVPFVQPSNINNGVLSKADCFLTEAGIEAGRLIPPNSILQVCIGTLGKCAINYDEVSCNQQINALTPLCCCVEYIMLAMSSGFFVNNLVRESASTTIAIINKGKWEHLLLPIPPFAEQERIVAKIKEFSPLIDGYGEVEKRLTTLNTEFPDKLRKSILQQAVQGKLTERDPADESASELLKRIRAEKAKLIAEGKIKKEKPLPPITDEEKPFDIPETWEWVRLSEICNISDGTHQTPKYVDKGVPFISAQNVKPYRFIPEFHRDVSREDYLEYNKVVAPAKGDILMTRVGAGIGEAAIIDQDFEFSIYVSLTLIKRYGNELNMEYLLHVLNSPLGRKLASRKTLGKGASQGNLNLIFIREFVLPIPPLAEQKRIVDRANELLVVCDGLK